MTVWIPCLIVCQDDRRFANDESFELLNHHRRAKKRSGLTTVMLVPGKRNNVGSSAPVTLADNYLTSFSQPVRAHILVQQPASQSRDFDLIENG